MFKKILIFVSLFIVCLAVFAGCGASGCGNKYNAELFDRRYYNIGEWLDKDFLNENRVLGAYYEYDDDTDREWGDQGYYDQTSPSSRTFIINNKQDFEKIFICNPEELTVNFESEMLIIYTFTAINIRPISIKKIKSENDTLKINMEIACGKIGVGDTCMPYQRFLFVKMNKLDITAAQIEIAEADYGLKEWIEYFVRLIKGES